MNKTVIDFVECDDPELVARSLAGDREAFSRIVAKYQSLVCSIAYSANGSLSQSEDLAQETFLAAWKQLGALREPEKLRAWLCGIVRNLVNNSLRKRQRDPSLRAETLDDLPEARAAQPAPSEEAIQREEEAILWRSLESIPPVYREPLILFYREGQSVGNVAQSLELTEDAVKQRLSRGRKLLQDRVAAFVEGALQRSVPGQAFTLGVMAALPPLTVSSKAALFAAGAAKTGTTAKAAAASGLLGTLLSPVMAVAGTWIGYKLNLDSARSVDERAFVKFNYWRMTKWMVIFGVAFLAVVIPADKLSAVNNWLFPSLLISLFAGWLIGFAFLATDMARRRRAFIASRRGGPEYAAPRAIHQYCSRAKFLGLPLVNIQIGVSPADAIQPVKGWFAAGDMAIGGLFAFGGMAVAPISIGGIAIGLLSFGGMAVGLLTLGGFAVGCLTFGAMGVGWLSFCACALAWKAAAGAVAVAHDFALGGFAQAAQANNDAARDAILAMPFFRAAYGFLPYLPWLNLLWVVPLFNWWRVVARARKQHQ